MLAEAVLDAGNPALARKAASERAQRLAERLMAEEHAKPVGHLAKTATVAAAQQRLTDAIRAKVTPSR